MPIVRHRIHRWCNLPTSSNMDLILFTLVAFFFSVPLMFLLTRKKSQSSIPSSIFAPGRPGWPIIGESLEFLNAGRRGVPDKFIKDRMQKFSSQIFRTSLLGEATAVMCGPTGNKFLFTNENKLATVWWPKSFSRIFFPSTQSTNNEDFLKMRKMLAVFINPETLQRHVGIMDCMAKKHLKENWDNQKEVIVMPLSKRYTFSLACKTFMSIDDPFQLAKLADPFSILSSGTGIISLPIDFPGTPFNKAIKASTLIRKELLEIIKQRKTELAEGKASPVQDILSHMLVTSDESGQAAKECDIADKILGVLLGGHGTASAAITFVVKYLAELPHVYDEVHKEQLAILNAKALGEPLNWEDIQKMKYSWNMACEVMRLAPPIQGAFRVALRDFNYSGFLVPKGWKLYWSTQSTHKNPIYFPKPEEFDPSRFEGNGPTPYTYVPFGGGPRICPGKEYARLKILIFIHNVVTRFKWEKILPSEKMVFDPLPMPSKGLPIRLEPHIY